MRCKTGPGRTVKRFQGVEALHDELRDELDHLRRLGVKLNRCTLREIATNILWNSNSSNYIEATIELLNQKTLHLTIDYGWILYITKHFRIVSRAHTGKHNMSPEKEMEIEVAVAGNLRRLSAILSAGLVDE